MRRTQKILTKPIEWSTGWISNGPAYKTPTISSQLPCLSPLRETTSLTLFTRSLISSHTVSHLTAIVDAELDHCHIQPFGILLSNLSKPVVLLKVSLCKYTHFSTRFLPTSRFLSTVSHLLLGSTTRVSTITFRPKPFLALQRHRHLCLSFDSAHDSTVPTEHLSIYQKILADILVDIDASTFNMLR